MQKNFGILLKRYGPDQHSVALFDRTLGRIDGFINKDQRSLVQHGALLFYYLEQTQHTNYALTALEIGAIPFELAKEDIYFLHHILELGYYFLPLHQAAPEIFILMQTVLTHPWRTKLLYLLRFFVTLGIYPEDLPFEKSHFHRLLSCPIELILEEKLDDTQAKMLESWLLRCMQMHPYKKQFKTYLNK